MFLFRTIGTSSTLPWIWVRCQKRWWQGITKTRWSLPKTSASFSATLKHTHPTRNHRWSILLKKVFDIRYICRQSSPVVWPQLCLCMSRSTPWPSACRLSLRKTSSPSSPTTSLPSRTSDGLVRGSATGADCTTEEVPRLSVHPQGAESHPQIHPHYLPTYLFAHILNVLFLFAVLNVIDMSQCCSTKVLHSLR